jgi:Tol biopolymer transport system component
MDNFARDKRNLSQDSSFDIMPQVTKDKKQIYFLSDRSGILQTWRMDINGGNLKQVTKFKTDIQDLAVYTQL